MTIWKFLLKIEDEQTLDMPEGAEILSVAMQGDTPCVWALVNPSNVTGYVRVETYGTGHPIQGEPKGWFLGMYLAHGGAFVGHVFVKESWI